MSLVRSDVLKHRRTWVAPLTVMGPLGVVLMGVIAFGLRMEWYQKEAAEIGHYRALMDQMGTLEIAAIMLGVALLASMVFDVDHRSGAWKQLFALPVSRVGIYLVKLGVVVALMGVASALAVAGIAGIWVWLDAGALPWGRLALIGVVPWVASFPLIAFQGFVSAHFKSQAVSITLGVAGMVAALFGATLPGWSPWSPPASTMEWIVKGGTEPWTMLAWSLGVGLVVAVAGAVAFARRDVV